MVDVNRLCIYTFNKYYYGGVIVLKKSISVMMLSFAMLMAIPATVWAGETESTVIGDSLRQVQQYNFSIQILAMLLVGFGFLMVFVKKYGYSATTGTYIVVAVGLPLYLLLRSTGILSLEAIPAG